MPKQRYERVLTLRLPQVAARRLTDRARAAHTTPSAFVRSLIDRELATGPEGQSLLERTRPFIGALDAPDLPPASSMREVLEEWNPDRRD